MQLYEDQVLIAADTDDLNYKKGLRNMRNGD